MVMRIQYCLLTLLLGIGINTFAQNNIQWYNPNNQQQDVVRGHAWLDELGNTYHRLPQKAKEIVPPSVWHLSQQSAGLSISFRSNAKKIIVRYGVNHGHSMLHMPATGKSGVDLYATDGNGKQHWCAGRYSFKDTITYTYDQLSYLNDFGKGYEYQLFLPPYNEVKWLEIGVAENSAFAFLPISHESPIVVYGTSIAQGACASRPGMIWTNIVERNLQHPIVNLGFSGSGMMESEVYDLLSEIPAKLFIIDCLPNLVDQHTSLIYERTINGVKKLRVKSNAPILLVEHSGYTNDGSSEYAKNRHRNSNKELRRAYEQLCNEGVSNLFYLTHKEINLSQDAMVEGIHPNDLGMQQYAEAYIKKIKAIFSESPTTLNSFKPCTQQRDPYDWKNRHEQVLLLNQQQAPQIVLIGNSITHYWAGSPKAHIIRGEESWNQLFKNKVVRNMGFGYDRIENALWRIYHGELDGYDAQQIILLMGTNNLSTHTNDEIIDGILQLVEAVRIKQPHAAIYVAGIMPRRNYEPRIAELNQELLERLKEHPEVTFIEMSKKLVDNHGKLKEKYFSDGLHPNAEGYEQVAKMLKKYIQ